MGTTPREWLFREPETREATIPREWLVEKIDTTDYETLMRRDLASEGLAEEQIDRIVGSRPGAPEEWEDFVRKMGDADELWRFRSPPETWQELAGREGFAIVRAGRPVAHYVTCMS